jgi:L-ascorbate metabolism protein UlaG (beta-lactamase superfamily)
MPAWEGEAVRTLVDRLESLVRRARRGPAIDRSVSDDRNAARLGLDLARGLEVQWLGTAGFRLAYEGTTLLVDPYVTRRDLRATVRRVPLLPDRALVDRLLPGADAVLVGHTHFDHAIDVPAVAARGTDVYGSPSMAHLLALHGLADRAVVVEPHRAYEIGPFTVRYVPSLHSKLLAGLAVPSDGELTCDNLDDLGMGSYRCGQVWGIHVEVGGTTLYHQGSANLIEDEYRYGPVDVFLCGIAGRLYTRDFTPRVMRLLSPRLVVPHHHDDFFRPVEGPMGLSFNVNLAGFVDDVAACDPDVALRTLDPLQTVGG